jgi:glucuronate isomerase
MRQFLDEDFMLSNKTASRLYHAYADVKKVPIIDYHCHIPVEEIWEDKKFRNMTELWLSADHYKWRQMRVCGIPEKYITGDGSDYKKFEAFASIMPKLLGNPLYHWSHLELKRYFGIEETLGPDTAEEIWNRCNEQLADPSFSARGLIKRSNVALICTTDDPLDDLHCHEKLAEDTTFDTVVLPAFRPDEVLALYKHSWNSYIDKLAAAAEVEIDSIDALLEALEKRIDYFVARGCKVSDHGLFDARFEACTQAEAEAIFQKCRRGETATVMDCKQFDSYMLIKLAKMYHDRDMVMQLHFGVVRDTNTMAFMKMGINTGFDSMHNETYTRPLLKLLDAMNVGEGLPKTILYSLNPIDNAAIDCVIGCFAEEGVKGKIQHGSAWWFNDHMEGMESQLKSYAALSTLGNHIGMLTDSRSLLSYTRHEYFRRILCNYIGSYVENGMYPEEDRYLEEMIRGISFENANTYFGFGLE